MREGFIDIHGYKTWYSIHGDIQDQTPLLVLHGGPGSPHYYLQPLEALADLKIPVVFYDQLGCGKSDRPTDNDLWTLDLFVHEIVMIRRALNLKSVYLLGHSWGGALALEYLFTRPLGVNKLILSSPLLDTQLWTQEAAKLINELPAEIATVMRYHEEQQTTDTPEYREAYQYFLQCFECRIVPKPALLAQAEAEENTNIYRRMWGPSETHATGLLKDFSAFSRLKSISIPTLLISGKYDIATPKQIQQARDAIPNAYWALMQNSSHSACLEETTDYISVIHEFLTLGFEK